MHSPAEFPAIVSKTTDPNAAGPRGRWIFLLRRLLDIDVSIGRSRRPKIAVVGMKWYTIFLRGGSRPCDVLVVKVPSASLSLMMVFLNCVQLPPVKVLLIILVDRGVF